MRLSSEISGYEIIIHYIHKVYSKIPYVSHFIVQKIEK